MRGIGGERLSYGYERGGEEYHSEVGDLFHCWAGWMLVGAGYGGWRVAGSRRTSTISYGSFRESLHASAVFYIDAAKPLYRWMIMRTSPLVGSRTTHEVHYILQSLLLHLSALFKPIDLTEKVPTFLIHQILRLPAFAW